MVLLPHVMARTCVREALSCHRLVVHKLTTGEIHGEIQFMPGALGYRAMPIGMTTTEKDTALASVCGDLWSLRFIMKEY